MKASEQAGEWVSGEEGKCARISGIDAIPGVNSERPGNGREEAEIEKRVTVADRTFSNFPPRQPFLSSPDALIFPTFLTDFFSFGLFDAPISRAN